MNIIFFKQKEATEKSDSVFHEIQILRFLISEKI